MLMKFLLLLLQSIIVVTLADGNYTLCTNDNLFQINWVNTSFNPSNYQYSFDILGKSPINITDINNDRTYYSAEKTEISVGLSNKYTLTSLDQFCKDVVNGCPILANNWTLLQKTLQLQEFHVPLADISAQYSAWTGDQDRITCVTFATIGYQDYIWARLFLYIPVSIGVFTIFTTLFSIYATTPIDRRDEWITFNYLPAALQLRLPGVFEVIHYAQFIFTMGLLNLAYPKFYPLFSSDFAWSFLLFPSQWIVQHLMPSSLSEKNQQQDSNVYGTGILTMTENIRLDINGLFVTVLVYFLLLVACCIIVLAILWLVLPAKNNATSLPSQFRYNRSRIKKTASLKLPALSLNRIIDAMVQCMTLCYIPLTLTALYQLMLPAPWYMLLAAAIVVVFLSFLLYGWIGFIILKLGDTATILVQSSTFVRIGSLYFMFSEGQAKFFLYTIIYKLIVSLMAGIFQRNGTAQLVVIIIAEFVYFVLHLIKWPYATKQINLFYIAIGFFRLTNVLLTIVHLPGLHFLEYDKQCVAYTQICFHMLCFILFFIVALKNVFSIILGTQDEHFDERNLVPVRMLRWPRYKRNNDGIKSRSSEQNRRYQLHHEDDEPTENDPIIQQNDGLLISESTPMGGMKNSTTSVTFAPITNSNKTNNGRLSSRIMMNNIQYIAERNVATSRERPEHYHRHLSAPIPLSIKSNRPPIPPPHIELPKKMKKHISSSVENDGRETAMIPLLIPNNNNTTIIQQEHHSDNNLHSKDAETYSNNSSVTHFQ